MSDVFGHPWLRGLFGDDEIAAFLSAEAELEALLRVEAAHARALGAVGLVDRDLAEAAAQAIAAAEISPDALREGSARDGMPVPGLSRGLKAQIDESLHPAVHKGMTSQDVIDTALVLALARILPCLAGRLDRLVQALSAVESERGAAPFMAQTRMQAALPVTVADRVAQWRRPLEGQARRLGAVSDAVLRVQLGGPVGDRQTWQGKGDAVATAMAADLGLSDAPFAWHSDRTAIADLGHWSAGLCGLLGKMGQDLALMAQAGTVVLAGAGGSSAMAHKRNPVLPELLVTLARYSAVQVSGLQHALVHEQERSGAMWTLEWMILPPLLMATGRSLTAAHQTVDSIERIGAG